MNIPPPLPSSEPLDQKPAAKSNLFIIILAVVCGLAASLVVLPAWLPGLVTSITGTGTQVFWYISRATAIMAYFILWLSMVWGVLMTGRLTAKWPGAPAANDLHKFTSLFGLGLGLLHGLLLIGDKYLAPSLSQILIPFSLQSYRPTWVGLGQISFYLWLVIIISFYLRKYIGVKTWRAIHILTFLTYASALAHGILAGTDTSTPWMTLIYWATGGVLLFLIIYRILAARDRKLAKTISVVNNPQ